MTDLIVKEKSNLTGTVKAPPSKAQTHRAFIASSLSEGLSVIREALISDDTLATVDACRMIGANIEKTENNIFKVHGVSKPLTPEDVINCRNSGSTMRFFTPICALADGVSVLTGGESLRKRPMGPLLNALRQLGVRCYSTRMDGYPPVVVFGGGIKGGKASIQGDVSSQFVSGLLLATPMARNDTDIVLSTSLESKPYVEITVDILRKHGVNIEINHDYKQFHVSCKQRYTPFNHLIEGDYSSAAFLLAAAAITNSHLKVENLKEDTLQGDRIIVNVLEKMGVQIKTGRNHIEVQGVENCLSPINIDMHDYPDLVPICVVLACLAKGKSVIRGVKRLRFKESDRIDALISELTKMGAIINAFNDNLEVTGGRKLHGTDIDSHGDHRIAMACTVAALAAAGNAVVHGIECINKSYPDFVNDICSLGGNIVER
ncbi:MAG: 3-phosphoshikimate 1-carboxyvinyltransferase [Candidatus Bathyarchaeia archaeon]